MSTTKDPNCCVSCGNCISKDWNLNFNSCGSSVYFSNFSITPVDNFDEIHSWFLNNVPNETFFSENLAVDIFDKMNNLGFVKVRDGDCVSFLLAKCPTVLCDIDPEYYFSTNGFLITNNCVDFCMPIESCCPPNECFSNPLDIGFYDGCKTVTVDAIKFSVNLYIFNKSGSEYYIDMGNSNVNDCCDNGKIVYFDLAYRISSMPYYLLSVTSMNDAMGNMCGTCFPWYDIILNIDFKNNYPISCGPLTNPVPIINCDWVDFYC